MNLRAGTRRLPAGAAALALTLSGWPGLLSGCGRNGGGPAPGAAARPASGEAEAALAQLEAAGAQVQTAVLSVSVERRIAPITDASDPEKALQAARNGIVQERRLEELVLSGPDWRRETTVMDPKGAVQARMVAGIRGGEGRVFEEQGTGPGAARVGTLGGKPELDPLVGLLVGRGGGLWSGARWSGAQTVDNRVLLSGAGEQSTVQVTLRTQPRHAVEKVTRSRTVESEQGTLEQKEQILVTYEGDAPKRVEHLLYAGAPVNRAMITVLEVKKPGLNLPVRDAALEVRIPAGVSLTDERHDPPLQYVSRERDLTEAELQALREQRRYVAKVDRPAPGWQLKTLGGQASRLQDTMGKVVVLTWFASW